MRTFWANQKITIVFNRYRVITAGFHQSSRNCCSLINVIQAESSFDIIVISGIDRSPFKNRHKVFFCVVYNGNLCIRQRKSSGHRYCIHIAEVRRHIITKMTRTICNMQNILHHSIGYGIISFILNSNNIKGTQNGIIRKPKLKIITR